jgi:hypothetical protein
MMRSPPPPFHSSPCWDITEETSSVVARKLTLAASISLTDGSGLQCTCERERDRQRQREIISSVLDTKAEYEAAHARARM